MHVVDELLMMGMVVPRSGLGIKKGIILSNTTGIIDHDYQGQICIALWNRSNEDFVVRHDERVCQMIFVPVIQPAFEVVDEFEETTARGEGGLGHTGTK
ncbi:MAG: hypothetical protein [Caudoviricetes sp.]|nr:MAG: hypothetical protein [Caudoviricetes sp.]